MMANYQKYGYNIAKSAENFATFVSILSEYGKCYFCDRTYPDCQEDIPEKDDIEEYCFEGIEHWANKDFEVDFNE